MNRGPADLYVREEDLLVGRYASRAELRRLHDEKANFETWSAFLVDAMEDWLPTGAAR